MLSKKKLKLLAKEQVKKLSKEQVQELKKCMKTVRSLTEKKRDVLAVIGFMWISDYVDKRLAKRRKREQILKIKSDLAIPKTEEILTIKAKIKRKKHKKSRSKP